MEKAPKVTVAPHQGRLGILTPGMGAVSTTLMAGVLAVRKGLAKPIAELPGYRGAGDMHGIATDLDSLDSLQSEPRPSQEGRSFRSRGGIMCGAPQNERSRRPTR